ncbi:iron ABC transporter permease [Synechococcus sp. R55.3]|uniref:ABC transporter permease n=1 Tax=Synechococcus sp. R55.3 TaxID=2969647 RepID=UPI0039C2E929
MEKLTWLNLGKRLDHPLKGGWPRWLSSWTLLTLALTGLLLIPTLTVLLSLFADERQVWEHLADTVLGLYVRNSLVMMAGVAVGVILVGSGTAWLVTMCQFWGRAWLEWMLVLPLAAPTYVLAYAYTDFLQVTGGFQIWLRRVTGWGIGDYWFPNIRSLWGAILLLILTLYPYVYLSARLAFQEQSVACLEVSRSLGYGPWASFRKVALPLARPGIVAGCLLALMETLNDFGTVSYFGVDTFTTGIYRTWTALGNPVAAAQLSALLLLLVLLLMAVEQFSRRRARYYRQGFKPTSTRYRLQGIRAVGAWLACGIPIGLGFVVPALILLNMTLRQGELGRRFWSYAQNSFLLSTITAVIAVSVSVVVLYGLRLQGGSPWGLRLAVQLSSLGYALPGVVIAVGVLIPLGWLDQLLSYLRQVVLQQPPGLVIGGTLTALVFGYLVRFLAVSLATVEATLLRIPPSLDEAARSLGQGSLGTLWRVHLPLMSGGILGAMLLVFVDVMKELPATMVLRPFNFDTLAVQTYRLAADERLAEAGAPALAIVLVGILPVILLNSQMARQRNLGSSGDPL